VQHSVLICLDFHWTIVFSVHIVAQQANRYIVAFHIEISYDIDGDGRGCEQQAV